MKRTEAQSNTILNQYLWEKRLYCYYELKVATGDRFFFSKIEENQKESLPALENEGIVWKLSDEDSRKKPCDGFCAPPLPAYLVIRFGNKYYFVRYVIIEMFIALGYKSITEQESEDLSDKVLST